MVLALGIRLFGEFLENVGDVRNIQMFLSVPVLKRGAERTSWEIYITQSLINFPKILEEKTKMNVFWVFKLNAQTKTAGTKQGFQRDICQAQIFFSPPLNQALTNRSRSKGIYQGTDGRNQACFSWKRKGKGKPHYVNCPQRPEGPSHREKHDLSWRSPWDKWKSTKRQNLNVRLLFKKMKLLGE